MYIESAGRTLTNISLVKEYAVIIIFAILLIHPNLYTCTTLVPGKTRTSRKGVQVERKVYLLKKNFGNFPLKRTLSMDCYYCKIMLRQFKFAIKINLSINQATICQIYVGHCHQKRKKLHAARCIPEVTRMHLHGPISGALHLERGASISPFFLSPDSVPGEIGASKEGVQVQRGASREVRVYLVKYYLVVIEQLLR